MTSNDELKSAITTALKTAGVLEGVRIEPEGNPERIRWCRRIGSIERYVRTCPITDSKEYAGQFSVLFGQNTGIGQTTPENFDARRWGTVTDVVQYVRIWLVDWRPRGDMPTARVIESE